MKNIILLSDGTGNSAAKLHKTNVWRLYQALDLASPGAGSADKPMQIAYYDDGVGSSSFKLWALLGGAFGWGLKRNVLDLYTFLCRHYQSGSSRQDNDRIFCFGFSRGAFTIRVLCGLIASQGLVQAETEGKLRRLATLALRAYYRNGKYHSKLRLEIPVRWVRDGVSRLLQGVSRQPRYDPDENVNVRIAFVGLWDTVDAYGMPIDELTRAAKWVIPLAIPNRNASDKIDRVCHALALDDERHTFHPVLFNESAGAPAPSRAAVPKTTRDERVCQVWFSGVHSNVGGGYPDDALAMVSLKWMMAEADGLIYKADERTKLEQSANACGRLYDSRRGLAGIYRYQPRKLSVLCDDKTNKVAISCPKIHESVFQRIRQGTAGYAPFNLPAEYTLVKGHGQLVYPEAPEDTEVTGEHVTQARGRANTQETVWNLVWWRRVVYFTSIAVVAWLAAFPFVHEAAEPSGGFFSFLSPAIRGVGSLLPGLFDQWIQAYAAHPSAFVGVAAGLAALLWLGGSLQEAARDRMRELWIPIIEHPGEPVSPIPSVPGGFLYWLRTRGWYKRFFEVMRELVLPFFAAAAVLWILIGLVSKFAFIVMSSAGYACAPTAPQLLATRQPYSADFPASAVCWASGMVLDKGTTYRITLTINTGDAWMDGRVPSAISGVSGEDVTVLMRLGTPFRRAFGQPWMKPIARIGDSGHEEYPLESVGGRRTGDTQTVLVAEITPTASGELFLFVNDAVLPAPPGAQLFYRNNQGVARIVVEPAPMRNVP